MQKRNINKATLLKSHSRTDTPPKIRSTSAELLLRENTSEGLILHVKRILKDLNYKRFLFTVFEINLLTLKMNK